MKKRNALIVVAVILLVALTGCKDTARIEAPETRVAMLQDGVAMASPEYEIPEGTLPDDAVSTDVAPKIPEVDDLPGWNKWCALYKAKNEYPGLTQGAITPSQSVLHVSDIWGRLVRHRGLLYLQYYIDIDNTSDKDYKDVKYNLIINEDEPRSDVMLIRHHELIALGSNSHMCMTPEPIEQMERLRTLRVEIVGYSDFP